MADIPELGLESLSAPAGPGLVARRPRLGVLVAAFLALAASGGLAWWIVAPGQRAAAPPPVPVSAPPAAEPAPQPLRFAADEPDPADVKRAHAEAQAAYANGGPDALARGSMACARAAASEPQRLDYCLAFDTYAREILPGAPGGAQAADWFAGAPSRDLALARGALPAGADAEGRLAQVDALAQAVLPKPRPHRPKAAAPVRPKPKAKLKAQPKPKLEHRGHTARARHLEAAKPRPAAGLATAGQEMIPYPPAAPPTPFPDDFDPPH